MAYLDLDQQDDNFRYKDDDYIDQYFSCDDFLFSDILDPPENDIFEDNTSIYPTQQWQRELQNDISLSQTSNSFFNFSPPPKKIKNQSVTYNYIMKANKKIDTSSQANNKKSSEDKKRSAYGICCFLSLSGEAEQFRNEFQHICGLKKIRKDFVMMLHNAVCKSLNIRKMSRDEYRSIKLYFLHFAKFRNRIIYSVHVYLNENPDIKKIIINSTENKK